MKRLSALLVAVLFASLPTIASAGEGDQVAQHQQAQLALLNEARWNPPGWGEANGIDLDGLMPKPPLAVNPNLTGSAAFKANEISETGFGDNHRSLVPPFLWPNELAIEWGYDLNPILGVETNTIEVFYAGAMEPVLAMLGPGGISAHRPILLEWDDRLEVGVGLSDAGFNWIIHVAFREATDRFLTGTVYDDLNGNGRMDAGEGLPGITVTAGDFTTLTNDGGGYSIEIPTGKYRVTASGAGFAGLAGGTVRVTDYNVSVDFISGVSRPLVRDYLLCRGRQPTILGTNGDDIIYGTSGPDVIHALGGDDIVYGARGNDVICGGRGDDILKGGGGRDILLGDRNDDDLNGGFGDDILKGGHGFDILNGSLATDTCLTGEELLNCEL